MNGARWKRREREGEGSGRACIDAGWQQLGHKRNGSKVKRQGEGNKCKSTTGIENEYTDNTKRKGSVIREWEQEWDGGKEEERKGRKGATRRTRREFVSSPPSGIWVWKWLIDSETSSSLSAFYSFVLSSGYSLPFWFSPGRERTRRREEERERGSRREYWYY